MSELDKIIFKVLLTLLFTDCNISFLSMKIHRIPSGLSLKSQGMLALWILHLKASRYLRVCYLRSEGTETEVSYF